MCRLCPWYDFRRSNYLWFYTVYIPRSELLKHEILVIFKAGRKPQPMAEKYDLVQLDGFTSENFVLQERFWAKKGTLSF